MCCWWCYIAFGGDYGMMYNGAVEWDEKC
jgi:hypothetical protein